MDLIKEEADKYQEFFNFMTQEHNLTLTISEMNEIIQESQSLVKKLNIVDVSKSLCTCNYAGTRGEKQCNHCLEQMEEGEF